MTDMATRQATEIELNGFEFEHNSLIKMDLENESEVF